MFEKMSLGNKLISGFIVIAMVILIVGIVGYSVASKMKKETQVFIETIPLLDASMEMGSAVMSDRLIIMEMNDSPDRKEIESFWSEHQENVMEFDDYVGGILNGGNVKGGLMYAATDEKMRQRVRDVDRFHNDNFQPLIEKIRDLKIKEIELNQESKSEMKRMEQSYGEIIESLEELEDRVKSNIRSLIAKGRSAGQIIGKENTWADVAMEMKITLAEARIIIEKSGQLLESESLDDHMKKFDTKMGEFDKRISALLKGGKTSEGWIKAVDDAGIRNIVNNIARTRDQKFNPAAEKLLSANDQLASVRVEWRDMDRKADEAGVNMEELLNEVETLAGDAVDAVAEFSMRIASASIYRMAMGVLIGFILAIILGVIITRSIARPINEVIEAVSSGSDQVTSAAAQISSSSQSIAEGATEQAASLEETSSSLEEMSSTIQQNADNAGEARNLSTVAKDTAIKGSESVKKMIDAANEINKSSEEVSKIIKVIDEIAFQTNLLALNAAVEAARAGEHGKGFAVVAEEVRNLAGRSAEAAKTTAGLIEDSTDKARMGAKLASESGDVLNEIVVNITKASDLIAEIAAASREQAEGINQVTKAVAQMDQVTQQNSAFSEETASGSEELSSQAENLKDIIDTLVAIIGGGGGKIYSKPEFKKEKSVTLKSVAEKPRTEDIHNILYAGKKKDQKKGFAPIKTSGKKTTRKKERPLPKEVIPLDEEEFREF